MNGRSAVRRSEQWQADFERKAVRDVARRGCLLRIAWAGHVRILETRGNTARSPKWSPNSGRLRARPSVPERRGFNPLSGRGTSDHRLAMAARRAPHERIRYRRPVGDRCRFADQRHGPDGTILTQRLHIRDLATIHDNRCQADWEVVDRRGHERDNGVLKSWNPLGRTAAIRRAAAPPHQTDAVPR
jgi:hypothetical protein